FRTIRSDRLRPSAPSEPPVRSIDAWDAARNVGVVLVPFGGSWTRLLLRRRQHLQQEPAFVLRPSRPFPTLPRWWTLASIYPPPQASKALTAHNPGSRCHHPGNPPSPFAVTSRSG